MIAILDPLLFDPKQPARPSDIKEVFRVLRAKSARIPDKRAYPRYWEPLAKEFIRPLSGRPEYRELDELRRFAQYVPLSAPPRRATAWGFRQMFSQLGEAWVEVMFRVVTGAVSTGEPTILLTHRREGRNMVLRQGPGRYKLREKTCWNLRVQTSSISLARVPLVCGPRNLDVPWTCRFDDRLPASADGAEFPFCPPADWQKSSVQVVFTHSSRPAWRDARGYHWARPATGGGHHWDVYLDSAAKQEYGLEQLNIVAWGAPPKEGAAGSNHHIPDEKQGRLRKKTGWSC